MNSIFSEQCWDDQCSLDVLVALSSQCKEIQYTFMKFSHVLSTLPPSLTNWDNQCSFLPNNVESQLIYGQLALPKKLQSLQIIALIVIRSSYCFDFVSHFVHLLFIYDINIIMYQIFLLQLHGWLPTKWRDFKSWLENSRACFHYGSSCICIVRYRDVSSNDFIEECTIPPALEEVDKYFIHLST